MFIISHPKEFLIKFIRTIEMAADRFIRFNNWNMCFFSTIAYTKLIQSMKIFSFIHTFFT
jgi:hypothetical protein